MSIKDLLAANRSYRRFHQEEGRHPFPVGHTALQGRLYRVLSSYADTLGDAMHTPGNA